jgi:hypothetical protein
VFIGDRTFNESSFPIAGRTFNRSHPAFNLQLQVRRARLVSAEAELKGMIQMFQTEAIRTSLVCSIQKGALLDDLGHSTSPTRPAADSSALCSASREVRAYRTNCGTAAQAAENIR